mgnify:CR=1 FL=1
MGWVMCIRHRASLPTETASLTDAFDLLALLRAKRGLSALKFGNPGAKAVWGDTKAEIIAAKKIAVEMWDTTIVDIAAQVLRRLLHELTVGARTAGG